MSPSKDSIIGSQSFEAKMRVVLELRQNKSNEKQKEMWVLKSNFLEPKYKNRSYVLEFTDSLTFNNTGHRTSKQSGAKSNNLELINKVLEYHKKGLSYRQIEDKLKTS